MRGAEFLLAAAAALPLSAAHPAMAVLERNCARCHGSSQQMSGFSLENRAKALAGGAHGIAIVPGKPDESPLLQRLNGKVQPSMPLGGKLSDDDAAVLRKWIADGAPWDAAAPAAAAATEPRKITDADRNWWAFRKPMLQTPPKASDPRWNRTAIDAFLFDKLREKELKPAPPAGKFALARRASLDLTGLPPTQEELDAFVNDAAPGAFARLVDRLLASPRYGERWGRHWLDVARYADSGGYEQDFTYPNAWRYRDYVIRAFNEDKPYDRFVREQIAGDELEDASYDALIATGFHRVGSTVGFREKDNPQYRFIYLDDMIGTTTRAFLGMTVACARCHDHKFDPILQTDYYKLMAVFYPYINYDHPLAPASEVAAYQKRKAEVDARTAPLKEKVRAIEDPYRQLAFERKLATFPADIQAAVKTPAEKRTEGQKLLAVQVLSIRATGYQALMKPEDRAELDGLRKQIREIERDLPKPLPVAMGVRDGDYRLAPMGPGDEEAPGKGVGGAADADINETYAPVAGKAYRPPKSYFLERGDYTSPAQEMQPGFLEVVTDLGVPHEIKPADGRMTTGRRRALAEWIASPENPLTARVMVNRIWQHHFGQGLVNTPSNFGRLGRKPSHPELLDWLALEFQKSGWSVKQMHRLIMNSEAYQMASEGGAGVEEDPENTLLWHYPQRRLEGESIRDLVLAVSGKLNLQSGGPAYFPPVAERVRQSVAKGIWEVNEEGPKVWRRGVYSYSKRGMKYPMFEVFDQPDPNVTCERRSISTVPTQALTMMNNEFLVQQAGFLAERVWQQAGAEQRPQVRVLYRLALSREPSEKELSMNVEFLNRQMAAHSTAAAPAREALADLAHVMINLNEFVYIP